MKKVNFETFQAWIDSEYPEIAIGGPLHGSSIGDNYALTLLGYDGPSVNEKGIEIIDIDPVPWDFHAKEIEWKAQDLLEGDGTDGIDFKEEVEDLLKVAKRVREKLTAAGRKDMDEYKDDYIFGEYPNGREFVLIPWKPEYLDEINEIVHSYFSSFVEDMDADEISGPAKRKTYQEWLDE